ncbi:uncharacterized protein LOC111339866 [Stylophora pistillata]|uniref:uncharacterized protein LOC111339866 n=1 Tax=Stylophora pistillata TaxID=50429 RepID=UPI000C03AE65|nr:uncharacterized protein LOC111339866 [Stylophora pistillata]
MTLIIFLLYACGLLNNAILFFWVYFSRSTPHRLNRILLVQLSLNTWNIIAHAAVEFSRQHVWIVLANSLSFFSNYLLATLVLSTSLGRSMEQRLKSKMNVAIFVLVSSILLVYYGRKFELCQTGNCFSPHLAKTDDELAILKSEMAMFYAPSTVLFFGSWYLGFRSCKRTAKKDHTRNTMKDYIKRFSLLFSNIGVSLFLLYGLIVMDGILYFNEDSDISMTNHLCRMSCLHEELYVLLAMFPVYMYSFMFPNDEKKTRDERF